MSRNKQITHRSMRGKVVDMERLRKKNELTPAVGNARVNARGDLLGPGGKIIKKREEIVKEHYKKTGAKDERGGFKTPERESAPEIKEEDLTQEELELLQEDDEINEDWIEDENGNFVQKGE